MHASVIRAAAHVASILSLYTAGLMLLPAAVDLYYGNKDWQVFAVCAATTGAIALTVAAATRSSAHIRSTRLTFLIVTVVWLTIGFIGALPLYTASLKLDFASAFFESISAVTTTGSTVISGLDGLPPGILLWRSLLQWIGGLGVIALGLFFLPVLNVGGFSYLRIESSDIEEKPFERLSSFLQALLAIYVALTGLCAFAYAAAGMTVFDAVNHAMTTISTGGFSTHDASFGYFQSWSIMWIATVFMILGALPFSILILLFVRGRLDALRDPQIRLFLAYVAGIVLILAIHRRVMNDTPFGEALVTSVFNIVSVITTTGFASEDYMQWGAFSIMIFFIATFLGGCSGSTSGGVKAYRFYILGRMLQNGLRMLIYARSVQPLRYANRTVDEEMQRAVTLFVVAFVLVWVVGSLALAAGNVDILTSLTATLTALTNVGPGLGPIVGPAGNFSTMSDYAKWILAITMLLGRLELLAVLVLLMPTFWRS